MDEYTNLEIHINFASRSKDDLTDWDILQDIEKLLQEKYGYSLYGQEIGPEPMKHHFVHKATFFPKECIS